MMSAAASGANPDPNSTTTDTALTIGVGTVATGSKAGYHTILQCPSHRWLNPSNAEYVGLRTSTRPYIKGLHEQYYLSVNDATVWEHRRIVFAMKYTFVSSVLPNIGAQSAAADINSKRQFRDMSGTSAGNYVTLRDQCYDYIFAGVDTTDWRNPMIAKVDRTRIDVISDRKHRISSDNAVGRNKYKKFWDPINKTIQYDDEENGLSVSPSAVSVQDKRGMGNLFVFDIFYATNPVDAATSNMAVSSQQTLYWHEK